MGQAETDKIGSPTRLRSHKTRVLLAGVYVRFIAGIAGVLLCSLIYTQLWCPNLHPVGRFPWASFVLLLVLAFLAEAYTINISPGVEVSAGFLACFLGFAVAGPLASFAIAVTSQLLTLKDRQLERTLCFASTIGIVAGGTSLLYWGALSLVGGFEQAPAIVVIAFGVGAGIIYQVLNSVLGVPVIWLRHGIGFKRLWREGFRPIIKFDLFFLVVSVGLISIYHLFLPKSGGAASFSSTLLVLLCLVPVGALVWALRQWATERLLAQRNERLAHRNELLAHRNERLALQAVASQVTALDLKDNYTARHSASVAQWARDIARAMGLDEDDQNLAHLAGVLHDVGKIGVPDSILKSSSPLDAENWLLIERHCENGYKVLCTIDQFDELATVVLHHHEHYDGNGYPGGLKGEEIPLISRIICVADSYSAMTSERPYGPPLSVEVSTAELQDKKGKHFDPDVVDAFLGVLAEHDEAYRLGTDVDFETEVHRIRFVHDLPLQLHELDGVDEPPEDGRGTGLLDGAAIPESVPEVAAKP